MEETKRSETGAEEQASSSERLMAAADNPGPRAHMSRVAWLLGLVEEQRAPETKLRLLRDARASLDQWRDQILLEVARTK